MACFKQVQLEGMGKTDLSWKERLKMFSQEGTSGSQ